MPRPKNPAAPTAAERARISRARHDMRSIMLPALVMAQLDRIAARDGDPSRVAALTRLIVRAAGNAE